VKKGQLLGLVGNSGTGSHPHLHVHREQGGIADTTKSGGQPVKIDFRNGLHGPLTRDGLHVEWESFAGQPVPPGPVLIWPSQTAEGEHGRHGQPLRDYALFFAHFADSGLWPEWLDMYSVGDEIFVNHLWRRARGGWRAYTRLTAAGYQEVFEQNIGEKLSPVLVDCATSGGTRYYAAVFAQGTPGDVHARHGLNYDQHMAEMKYAAAHKLCPVSVSVVSVGGQLDYTVLYRSDGFTNWTIKSRIREGDYQAEYDAQSAEGRKPVHLSAYVHEGKPYLAAVFAEVATNARHDRHLMSGAEYQAEYTAATEAGMSTRVVTAFNGAKSQHRFAASWWQ
jgi:hypothetical protein